MAAEDNRIFVGGLSWETTDRALERAFSQFGKVIESQVILERDTRRSRGFGFVTFADSHSVDTAIREMHDRELDGRNISVNKAQPRMNSDDSYAQGGGGYSSGGRGYRGEVDAPPAVGRDDCFKCGRPGHWARECPSAGGGSAGRLAPPSRYLGRSGDTFEGSGRYGDRYFEDRYDGGHSFDRDRLGSRDERYGGGRERYARDDYAPGADRFPDRYGGAPDRYEPNGFGKERSYDRDVGRANGGYYRDGPRGYDRDAPPRGRYGGSDRYGGGGPARYDRGNRDRPGPYDRPSRGGAVFDDRY